MTATVFIAVIGAALLHAVWNAIVKGGSDKYVGMAGVVLGHVPLAVLALFFFPAPAPQSWPWMLGGMFLHFGYQLFLLLSYRIGDLTQVYPIARGSAPLLVTGISVLLIGVHLEPAQLAAVLLIAAGIISISLVRQRDGLRNPKAALMALTTGCFIAGYSLVDGTGARLSGSSVGFYAWLSIANAVIFLVFVVLARPGVVTGLARTGKKVFVIGGSASFVAYAIVTWAFTQAPIALVTALRETSIIFALLIGVFFLKERLNLAKVVSTAVTLAGAALLRFAR